MSKSDELAASLAAHQEYHLQQADELQRLRLQLDQMEEECRSSRAEVNHLQHQLQEAVHGRQLFEAEAKAREEMCRGLSSDKEAGLERLRGVETALREERDTSEGLRQQVGKRPIHSPSPIGGKICPGGYIDKLLSQSLTWFMVGVA